MGSLANHRCYPNTNHVFDDKQRMVARAAVFIPKGSEIFHSYSRLIWGTAIRIYHLLNTKHFICKCERCADPTEFGTYINAVFCTKCRGNVIPVNPSRIGSQWQCETCKNLVSGKDVGKLMSLLGSVLKGFDNQDFRLMYRFLNEKVCTMVPESNQIVIELKYKIIWILGYEPGFLWKGNFIIRVVENPRFVCFQSIRSVPECKLLFLFNLVKIEYLIARKHTSAYVFLLF